MVKLVGGESSEHRKVSPPAQETEVALAAVDSRTLLSSWRAAVDVGLVCTRVLLTFKKQISTNDAQDISCSIDYLFLANTLGRSLDKYDLNLNFIKKIKLNNLSLNSRVLLKTVCVDKFERIYTATFDDFKIYC